MYENLQINILKTMHPFYIVKNVWTNRRDHVFNLKYLFATW